MSSSSKFLPPNVSWQLRLTRNDPSYGLILEAGETKKYNIVLLDLKLITRRVVPTPFALERYRNKLAVQDAIMDFKSGQMRSFQISNSLTSMNIPNVATGPLPHSLIVTFVSANAFSGTSHQDVYKFEGFNLSSFNCKVSGQNVMASAYKPDFQSGENLMYMYKELLQNTGYAFNSQSVDISYEDFITNKFFIALDLSPDQCNFAHNHPTQVGDISFELSWGEALPQNIVCLVWMCYSSFVKINNYNQVEVKF